MKKTASYFFTLAICISFSNCVINHGHKSGSSAYSETNLGDGSFSVRFQGKKNTSADKASDFCMLRCAQLARENNYDYFKLVQSPGDSMVNAASRSQSTKTVKFLKEKPEGDNVYETTTVLETLSAKYHIKIKDPGGSIHSSPWE